MQGGSPDERVWHRLGLPEPIQDWGIEHADAARLDEFLDLMECEGLCREDRFDLAELILASANERLGRKDSLDWGSLESRFERYPSAYALHLEYWAGLSAEYPIAEHLWGTAISEPANNDGAHADSDQLATEVNVVHVA